MILFIQNNCASGSVLCDIAYVCIRDFNSPWIRINFRTAFSGLQGGLRVSDGDTSPDRSTGKFAHFL